MIYISHRLEELPQIADRVTVLRDGETIETREMATVNRDELIKLMVGRELSQVFPKKEVKSRRNGSGNQKSRTSFGGREKY